MKLIILSFTKYKEKDAIISAINSQESFSFLAKGVLAPTSKNAFIISPLSIVDVTFNEGNYRYPVLKESSLIYSPLKGAESIEKMSLLMSLQEATNNMLQEEEKYLMFPLLEEIIQKSDQKLDYQLLSIYYLAKVLSVAGYEFETNQCLFCGSKKDIVAFSFSDGGFICKNCIIPENIIDLTPNQLRLIYDVFSNCSLEQLLKFNFDHHDIMVVFDKIDKFVIDNFSFRLKSLSLLK